MQSISSDIISIWLHPDPYSEQEAQIKHPHPQKKPSPS